MSILSTRILLTCLVGLIGLIGYAHGDELAVASNSRWTPFRYVALEWAKRRGKWLIVIDLPEDFTCPACTSPLGETLQATTLNPTNLPREIADSFEIVVRPVGPRRFDADTTTAKSECHAPLVYYCDLEWRVWHFSIGFPTHEMLLADANWVIAARNASLRAGSEDQQQSAIARFHRDALEPAAIHALASRKVRASMDDHRKLVALIEAANQWRLQALTQPFKKHRTAAELIILAPVLAQHGTKRNGLAHLVLTERPLLSLDVVSPLVFPIVNNTTFWEISSRRAELFLQLEQQRQEGIPTLLVVQPNAASRSIEERSIMATVWKPPDRSIAELLDEFLIAEITHAELQLWLSDARRELPQGIVANRRGLVFLDELGRIIAVVDSNSPEKQLRSVLAAHFPAIAERSSHETQQ